MTEPNEIFSTRESKTFFNQELSLSFSRISEGKNFGEREREKERRRECMLTIAVMLMADTKIEVA